MPPAGATSDVFLRVALGLWIRGGPQRRSDLLISSCQGHTVDTTRAVDADLVTWRLSSNPLLQAPPSLPAERFPQVHCQPEAVNTSSSIYNKTSQAKNPAHLAR